MYSYSEIRSIERTLNNMLKVTSKHAHTAKLPRFVANLIDKHLGISAVRKALDSGSVKFPSTECIVEAIEMSSNQ